MRTPTLMLALAGLLAGPGWVADTRLPTGQYLTPLAVPGARFSPLVARNVAAGQ